METTHYIYDLDGNYIGAFDDASLALYEGDYDEGPAPAHALDKWIGGELIPANVPDVQGATKAIKDAVGLMDPAVLIRYAGEASLIGQFLDNANIEGAIGLLLALSTKITDAQDSEGAAALAPVMTILEQAGLLP